MRNLLKNIFTTFESNTEQMLTPEEQTLADSAFHFLNHEINEIKNIIIEEENAQNEAEKSESKASRVNYDLDTMKKIKNLIEIVSRSINFLSVKTSQKIMERSKSNIAKIILTPQDLCYVKGTRRLDPSTISPVHPHEIQDFKGAFPQSFKNSLRRINAFIDQEKLFPTFAPIYPQLGKNLQYLYVITS